MDTYQKRELAARRISSVPVTLEPYLAFIEFSRKLREDDSLTFSPDWEETNFRHLELPPGKMVYSVDTKGSRLFIIVGTRLGVVVVMSDGPSVFQQQVYWNAPQGISELLFLEPGPADTRTIQLLLGRPVTPGVAGYVTDANIGHRLEAAWDTYKS